MTLHGGSDQDYVVELKLFWWKSLIYIIHLMFGPVEILFQFFHEKDVASEKQTNLNKSGPVHTNPYQYLFTNKFSTLFYNIAQS